MKKNIAKSISLILVITMILSIFPAAIAENVAQKTYTVMTNEYTRQGTYTGEMKNGKPHGFGVFVAENDSGIGWHYVGSWKEGLMSGQGGTYWDDGSVEIGIYENGIFIDGTIIDGNGKSKTYSAPVSKNEGNTENSIKYIGNKNTKKFHYPDCSSVDDMKESNKITLNSRDEAIKKGYKPCGRCNP